MVFVLYLLSFLIFLYGALSAPLDYAISSEFNVLLWGLVAFSLAHVVPGAVTTYRTRNLP